GRIEERGRTGSKRGAEAIHRVPHALAGMAEGSRTVRAAARAGMAAEGQGVVHGATARDPACSVELGPGPDATQADVLAQVEARVVAVARDLDLGDRLIRAPVSKRLPGTGSAGNRGDRGHESDPENDLPH